MKYDKLKKTCERILALEDNFILSMESYTSLQYNSNSDKILSGKHPCGTTYCIAGMLAHLDDYPEKYVEVEYDRSSFDYHMYIERELTDIEIDNEFNSDNYYEWLFNDEWPNSLKHAKIRAQYLLDNNFIIPFKYSKTNVFLDQLISKVTS